MPERTPEDFVVDDEPVIANTVAIILQQSGFSATPFTNPLDALERACQEAPDLLLSDVAMPHLSGIDLALEIKAKIPECGVLLFSGQSSDVDLLRKAWEQGHDFPLLEKPIHPTDLWAHILQMTAP